MPSRKRIVWILTLGIGIFLILVTIGYVLTIHNLGNTFAKADLEPFGFIFKKAIADLVVVKQSPKKSVRAEGYLDAYERDPAAFQSDSRLFDTWVSSTQIGEETQRSRTLCQDLGCEALPTPIICREPTVPTHGGIRFAF